MNDCLDILKYLVYGMIVYTLFTYIPQVNLPLSDVMVITCVIMMTYIFLDILAPQKNIENLDPNFLGESIGGEDDLGDLAYDPSRSDFASSDTDDISGTYAADDSDAYKFSSNDNSIDNTLEVARILVNSGITTDSRSELLNLCKTDKNGCYNKISLMRKDEIITKDEFDKLIEILVSQKSTYEKLVEQLDLTETEKHELIKLCRFNKNDCKKSIELINNITPEQKLELHDELDNLYNSDYLLDISILSNEDKNRLKTVCNSDLEQCEILLNSFENLNDIQRDLILNSFKQAKLEEEQKEKIIDQIYLAFERLMSEGELSENVIKNLYGLCDTKEKCNNKINELELSGLLNNKQKKLIESFFGLNGYVNLSFIVSQNELNLENTTKIANVCNKFIPISMASIVLNKLVSDNIITQEQSEDLLDKLRRLSDGKNLQGSDIINQLLENDEIKISDATSIHKLCSLKNNQNCLQKLKQLMQSGTLTETQMKQILRSYNKSDAIDLDSKDFGAISNGSDLASKSNGDKLSSLKDAFSSSDMKYSQLGRSMHEPLGKYNKDFSNNFEYGYSYLNTDKWSVPMYRPPVCKSDESCKVCSSNTTGYPVDVKEWHSSSKILPPDNINLEYINKLNEGK